MNRNKYSTRRTGFAPHGFVMLMETADAPPDAKLIPCTAQHARDWVKRGRPHETGLYVNADGRVRYAESMQ